MNHQRDRHKEHISQYIIKVNYSYQTTQFPQTNVMQAFQPKTKHARVYSGI
jgi:hypothetical protein